MRIPFTILNLLHQRLRTLVAIAGVAFSMLLVFMQLGFFGSAAATATIFFDKLDFDLILVSRDYSNITQPASFPRIRLYQCQATPGVATVSPMWVNGNLWRIVNDQDKSQHGLRRGIMVVGFDLGAGRGTIVGTFTIGAGYGWDGMVLMSAATYSHIYGNMPLNHVSFGLIR